MKKNAKLSRMLLRHAKAFLKFPKLNCEYSKRKEFSPDLFSLIAWSYSAVKPLIRCLISCRRHSFSFSLMKTASFSGPTTWTRTVGAPSLRNFCTSSPAMPKPMRVIRSGFSTPSVVMIYFSAFTFFFLLSYECGNV